MAPSLPASAHVFPFLRQASAWGDTNSMTSAGVSMATGSDATGLPASRGFGRAGAALPAAGSTGPGPFTGTPTA
ncbi:MAG: hypothetical protein ACEQSU_04625 [Microgenomates group bacterium]